MHSCFCYEQVTYSEIMAHTKSVENMQDVFSSIGNDDISKYEIEL